jgi:hypothetical protein
MILMIDCDDGDGTEVVIHRVQQRAASVFALPSASQIGISAFTYVRTFFRWRGAGG